MSATGIYSNEDAIVAVYGIRNVSAWSNLDSDVSQDAPPDETHVQSALGATDAYINWMATLYGYAIPVANTITNWTRLARLGAEDAGIELYIARGLADDASKGWAGKMAQRRKELRGDELNEKMGAIERFFYEAVDGAALAPGGVSENTLVIGSSNVFANQDRCASACGPYWAARRWW